jgi:hypothetical protein
MSDLERQMMNYRLTTAEIIYHMPDHPDLLQTFIWQTRANRSARRHRPGRNSNRRDGTGAALTARCQAI